jgi:hypothetical protein
MAENDEQIWPDGPQREIRQPRNEAAEKAIKNWSIASAIPTVILMALDAAEVALGAMWWQVIAAALGASLVLALAALFTRLSTPEVKYAKHEYIFAVIPALIGQLIAWGWIALLALLMLAFAARSTRFAGSDVKRVKHLFRVIPTLIFQVIAVGWTALFAFYSEMALFLIAGIVTLWWTSTNMNKLKRQAATI